MLGPLTQAIGFPRLSESISHAHAHNTTCWNTQPGVCAAAAAAAARAGKSPSWARRARVTRQQQQRHSYLRTPLPPPPHPHALRTDRQADRRAARTYVSFRQVGPLDSTHRRVYVCVCPLSHLSSPQSVPSPREPAGAAIDGGGLFFSVVVGGGEDRTGLDWTGSRGESAHCRLARQGGAWQSSRCCCCCCWCCIVAA